VSDPTPTVDQATRERLERATKDFKPSSSDSGATWPFSGVVTVSTDELPVPRLVQWILGDFLGSPDGGVRWDKTAWRYWFTYKDKPFSMAHEKFGIRLYGSALTGAEFEGLAREIVGVLNKAIGVAERNVFQAFADEQVQAGHVTVNNEYHRMRNMYEYFRWKAERGPEDDHHYTLYLGGIERIFVEDEHRFHYTVALLTAYFNWLEHTLVLLWPFCGYSPGRDNLEGFIRDIWGRKFRQVFDLSADTTANRHFERLTNVCEEYRNTYSHGGFGKQRRGLLVHAPGGAIVAGLSSTRQRPHFDFYPVREDSLADILAVLDAFDAWLRSGPAEYGMQWVEAGLPAFYDAAHINEAHAAIGDDTFDDLLDRTAHVVDQYANMDW
jgi:hypothetical protein